jgi:hypothetical protein
MAFEVPNPAPLDSRDSLVRAPHGGGPAPRDSSVALPEPMEEDLGD